MKKWIAILLSALLLMTSAAFAEDAEVETAEDSLSRQAQVDAALIAEAEAGYEFENPLVVVNPYGNAPLSAVAIFTTEEAVGGTVTAKGKAPEDDVHGTFPEATVHYVPILGLYAGEVTEVEIALDDGRTNVLQVEADVVPLLIDSFAAETFDAEAYDGSELNFVGSEPGFCFAGFDSQGTLRWAITDTIALSGIAELENGRMLIPSARALDEDGSWLADGVREIDGLGRVYNEYIIPGGEHHEVILLPNGNYMYVSSTPGIEYSEDYIVEFDPIAGEITWELYMDELIARDDGGAFGQSEEDWVHANALCYDEANDLLLISCRNLSAVVAVHKEEKTLAWVLSDPAGWETLDPLYLLTPEGADFEWPFGQHNVSLLSDGTLLLFDNGFGGRAKLVHADSALEDADNYSRAVRYRIDPEAMTVEQVWQYGKELGSKYYSRIMSSVECVDELAESYFMGFGACKAELDEIPDNEGTINYMQYIQNDEVVWEASSSGEFYRSFRANLYEMAGNFDIGIGIRLVNLTQ